MKQTLFIGDINVDIIMEQLQGQIKEDKEILCRNFSITMGSSAVISACHFARAGGKAAFCGMIGKDTYGRFMLKGLKHYGIDTRLLMHSDIPTGVTVNLIRGRTRSQVTYPGTIAAFNGRQLILDSLKNFAHLHFAGVYLQESFRPHIAEILTAAHKSGLTTSMDPQWDSNEQWEFMDDWLPRLTYLFVNEDEALSISRMADPESAYWTLKEKTNMPIVKIGKRGVCHSGKIYPPIDVPVIDTTGAGDTFAGVFLQQVTGMGAPVEQAIEAANKEASNACTFTGGLPQAPAFG